MLRNAKTPLFVSLLAFALASVGLWRLTSTPSQTPPGSEELVVLCAAGVRPAVEPILERYASEHGVQTRLQVGPSGGLEAQIKLSGFGDLFLPAATDPFLLRLQKEGRVREVIPVARMRLVVALSPEAPFEGDSLQALIESGAPFGLCNEQAAAGQRTRRTLEALGLWERVSREATASLLTVTELAEAVRDGGRLQAGVVWSTTAKQFGLRAIETPELQHSGAAIGAGVLTGSRDPAAATRLARYLSASGGGEPIFIEQGYQLDSRGGERSPDLKEK